MRTLRKAAIFFTVALALLPGRAAADDFHYINKLIGERAALMGGAFTAVSDDPSGCYYNPSGVMRVTHESFSLSANLNEFQQETREDFLSGRDVVLRSSQIVPTFWGVVRPIGGGRVCFSVVVPDFTNLQAHKSLPSVTLGGVPGDLTVDLISEDAIYLIGPSYARGFGRFSLGASLFVAYRKSLAQLRALFIDRSGGIEENFTSADSSGYGLTGALGGMYDLSERISLGLVYRPPGRIRSDRRVSEEGFNGPAGAISREGSQQTGTITEELAQSVTVGGAYRPSERFLISADLSAHAPISYGSGNLLVRKRSVYNLAFGTEYRPAQSWRFLAGVFTDQGSAPEPTNRINIYGASAGVSLETPQSSTTLGLVGSGGAGNYPGVEGTTKRLLRLNIAVVLGGSVHF